jgi:hypothetical protein
LLLLLLLLSCACSEAGGQFTDTIRFPCGARRDYGTSAGVAYVVPTGVGTCRQYHAFLVPQAPAKQAAGNSSSSRRVLPKPMLMGRLQMLLRVMRPVWAWHMFSHMLVDADLAMQRCVDINRCAAPFNQHVDCWCNLVVYECLGMSAGADATQWSSSVGAMQS